MTNPTPQLTEEAVREIEVRADAATKGDWTIRGGHWIDGGVKLAGYGIRFSDSSFEEGYGGWDACTNFPPETPEGAQASADRSFLAHARVDIGALIRDWRAMRARLKESDGFAGAATISLHKLGEENDALRSERDGLRRRVEEMKDERR